MRTLIKSFSLILMFAALTFAGHRNIDTQQINKNLLRSLNHDNPGVVESSIKVVILMKAAYPKADYDNVIEKLESLIIQGANKNIRLKALIASDYLRNFEQYRWLKNKDYSDGDQVFADYLQKMSFDPMVHSGK